MVNLLTEEYIFNEVQIKPMMSRQSDLPKVRIKLRKKWLFMSRFTIQLPRVKYKDSHPSMRYATGDNLSTMRGGPKTSFCRYGMNEFFFDNKCRTLNSHIVPCSQEESSASRWSSSNQWPPCPTWTSSHCNPDRARIMPSKTVSTVIACSHERKPSLTPSSSFLCSIWSYSSFTYFYTHVVWSRWFVSSRLALAAL